MAGSSRRIFGKFLAISIIATAPAWAQVERPTIQAEVPTGEGPAPEDWAALADLPDWTGVWVEDRLDQIRQERLNDVPWNEQTAVEVERQIELEKQGMPRGTHNSCLPWGIPSAIGKATRLWSIRSISSLGPRSLCPRASACRTAATCTSSNVSIC